MTSVFSVGLSFLPNNGKPLPHTVQHAEGQRILSLLEKSASPPGIIQRESSGRPCFADHHADFNISHSQSMIAVSFSTGISLISKKPFRTGCDIQSVREGNHYDNILFRFFTSREQEYVLSAGISREKARRFCRIWVLKECFLKLHGLQAPLLKEAPCFAPPAADNIQPHQGSISLINPKYTIAYYIYECGEDESDCYMLAIARETLKQYPRPPRPELFWFSSGMLPLRPL
jgi:hypothetical protein